MYDTDVNVSVRQLTVSRQEVRVEGLPGLSGGENRVVVGEVIEGDQSVFGVPEDHQHLHHVEQNVTQSHCTGDRAPKANGLKTTFVFFA